MEKDESMTRCDLSLLGSSRNDAYKAALAALRDARQWWKEMLGQDPEDLDEGEGTNTADAAGLRQFLSPP